jgi:hypothetical protein
MNFLARRRGASTPNYILIVTLVVGFFLLIFWSALSDVIVEKLHEIGVDITLGKRKRKHHGGAAGESETSKDRGSENSRPGGRSAVWEASGRRLFV